MRALVTAPPKGVRLITKDIPTPSSIELLVRIKAIALNSVDALYVDEPSDPGGGRVIGSDFSGEIVLIGGEVQRKDLQVGDKVAGFLSGACTENEMPGAFAEYAVIQADLVFKLWDTLRHEEAATIPMCFMTSVQALHRRLGILPPFQTPTEEGQERRAILINGGATSPGLYAVQLAHQCGLVVFATASPKNHEYLRSLGADFTFDYRDPIDKLVSQIRSGCASYGLEGDGVTYGLDCIAEGDSTRRTAECFSSIGGKCIVLRSQAWDTDGIPKRVEVEYTAVWSMLGREFFYNGDRKYPEDPKDRAMAASFYDWLSKGHNITPNRPRILGGGLGEVEFGLKIIGSGRISERVRPDASEVRPISAEKLVYRITTEDP